MYIYGVYSSMFLHLRAIVRVCTAGCFGITCTCRGFATVVKSRLCSSSYINSLFDLDLVFFSEFRILSCVSRDECVRNKILYNTGPFNVCSILRTERERGSRNPFSNVGHSCNEPRFFTMYGRDVFSSLLIYGCTPFC